MELAPIIKNPKQHSNYEKYKEAKKRIIDAQEELKQEMELKERMKAMLSKEEYARWSSYYSVYKNYDKNLQRYRERREREVKMNLDEMLELAEDYPPFKKERTIELELLNKYRPDYVSYENKFKLYWRYSKLNNLIRIEQTVIKSPIKLIPTPWIEYSIRERLKVQKKVYNYVKPYLDEIQLDDFWVREKQLMLNKLQYNTKWWTKLRELASKREVSENVMCMIINAVKRDKYIKSLPYYWISYLCWDRIFTGTWQLFVVSPFNNWKYLTPDNFDKVHEDTQNFLHWDSWDCAIAIAYYWYIEKVPRERIYDEEGNQHILSWDYYFMNFRHESRVRGDPKNYSYKAFYKHH